MNVTSATLGGSQELVLGQVAERVNRSLREGREPKLEDLVRQHPELESQIRQLVPALVMLHQIGHEPERASGATAQPESQAAGQLGDYRIIREIGRGGMGIVYEAEQISMHRHVALKVLPFAAVLDSKQLQRFKNEAHAAGQLHHQNIVPVYFVGCERGVHYYAMQFIEGQTLAELIRDLRHLTGLDMDRDEANPIAVKKEIGTRVLAAQVAKDAPPSNDEQFPHPVARAGGSATPYLSGDKRQSATSSVVALSTERSTKSSEFFRNVAKIGVQAAGALEHAHALGIVHRDIKPANLLLDVHSNLWITDFGLAHVQTEVGLTMTGDLLGTLRYMSPEQALAKRVQVDHRTDIYSLGVTLYELLTLEPAFPGHDRQEVLRQIAFEEPRLPRRLNRAMPAELETIVLKAIAKNPAERYASAQALADDLNRFLEDKPILAKRPSILERTGKWSRRHKTLVNMAAVLVVLVAIVATTGYVKTSAALSREAAAHREADAARSQAELSEAKAKKSADIALAINNFFLHDIMEQANPDTNPGAEHLTVRQLIDMAAKQIDKSAAFAHEPEVEAAIHHTLGDTYNELGAEEEAEKHLRRALDLRVYVLGHEHLDTLITMNRLAWALAHHKPAEAGRLAGQVANIGQRVLVQDHPETIYAVDTVAIVLQEQGKLSEAVALERPNLEAARRALGRGNPQTLIIANNLALILKDFGKLAESEEMLRENLDDRVRARGADHPDAIAASNNLAFVLLARGKPAEAEPYLDRVMQDCIKVYGPEHFKTLMSTGNLAAALRDQDRLEEASALLRQALQTGERVYPANHPTNLTNRNKLALVLEQQGETAEAEEIALRLRDTRRRLTSSEHPQTLVAVNTLGLVLEHEGRLGEAGTLFQTNLDARLRVLGADHPETLQSIGNLARVFIAQGKPADAVPVLREAIAVERNGPPAVPRYFAEHLALLGQALTELADAEEARPLLEESLAMHRELWPDPHWRTAHVQNLLGGCLTAEARYEEAEPLLLASSEFLCSAPRVPPDRKRLAIHRTAKLYEAWGKPNQAAEWRAKLPPDSSSSAN